MSRGILFGAGLIAGWATAWAQGDFPVAAGAGLAPAAAARAMTLPPGFHASVFAAEPAVHQPIAFTIDERGRLWVVENYAYPEWAPYGRDRIVIFEDTDGDGRFDRQKVFYDQLNFASGIAVGHGGVWVGSPPYLLFIADKNRDDVPDAAPQVILDGWGHDDTHETLNSFVWGPDGWLYGNQGVFTHSHVGRPGARDADRTPLNACVWRYHPTKKIFEIFSEGMSNQWGLDFNDVGDSFVTACVIPHLWHVIQGGHYQRQSGPHFNPYVYEDLKTIADHFHYDRGVKWSDARFQAGGTDAAGGGHAHAGTLIYLGNNFPAEYRGMLLSHNVLGSRINRDTLEPFGSGYVGHHAPDFMKANDAWFRGLRLETGPDGSLFGSDWYDARACHQQQPHDRTNGRIYKYSYGEPKPVLVDLSQLSNLELVALQLHPNEWHVRRARLLLQERAQLRPDPAVHAALRKIVRENPEPPRQLRALWALHVTRGLTEATALEVLKLGSAHVRGWAIQLACEDRNPTPALLQAFAELARTDASPVVRRFLASAAQRIPVVKRWDLVSALLAHGEDASDPNLPLLYWFAAEPLVPADPTRAAALAKQTPLAALRPWFTRRAAALADQAPGKKGAKSPQSGLDTLAAALVEASDPAFQREMLASLRGATEGATGVKAPAGWSAAYAKLSLSPESDIIAQADALAARFGDKSVFAAKRRILTDAFAPLAARQAALSVVAEQNNFQLAPLYHGLLAEPGLRLGALRALAPYDVPATPPAILAVYPSFAAEEKRVAVALLSSRPGYARALLAAVKSGAVARAELDASVARQIRLHRDPALERSLAEVWGVARESAADTNAEVERWKTIITPQKLALASPARGQEQFARLCSLCHVLYGEGRAVGPELTGANRGDLDYLLRNIVDPNSTIGKDYQLTTAVTTDGRVIAGIVQSESPTALTLANQMETLTLARDRIKKIERLEVSLMPPGLLSSLSETDAADLIAYLRAPTPPR